MMFHKYISKISNTIGTVNYLQQKTRKSSHPHQIRSRQSSKQLLYDDGYDVVDANVSPNASRKSSVNEELVSCAQTILSESVARLRTTLLFYPWFHGYLSARDAEKILAEHEENGLFLVRESQSNPGDFVLSVYGNDKVTHVKVHRFDDLYHIDGGKDFTTLYDLIEHYKLNPMVETSGIIVNLINPYNPTTITAAHIDAHVERLQTQKSSDYQDSFWHEFESLQQQETKYTFSQSEGHRFENRNKNRYKNILPFDHTRVRLLDNDASVAGSDYINANYLRQYNTDACDLSSLSSDTVCAVCTFAQQQKACQDCRILNRICVQCTMKSATIVPDRNCSNCGPDSETKRERSKWFIATQGCLDNTINDFWNMIWQENTRVIVMTTKEMERGKAKCAKYWPDVGQTKEWGPARVTCLTEEMTNDYTLRQLVLTSHDESERHIYQYHFQVWPDHGVPDDPGCVLNFLNDINLRQAQMHNEGMSPGPICVHCSAGIGRTGTFIVINMILDVINRHGINAEIDIHRTIQMVRVQRAGMVQTDAQHKFIYYAVRHHIQSTIHERAEQTIEQQQSDSDGEHTNVKYVDEVYV